MGQPVNLRYTRSYKGEPGAPIVATIGATSRTMAGIKTLAGDTDARQMIYAEVQVNTDIAYYNVGATTATTANSIQVPVLGIIYLERAEEIAGFRIIGGATTTVRIQPYYADEQS